MQRRGRGPPLPRPVVVGSSWPWTPPRLAPAVAPLEPAETVIHAALGGFRRWAGRPPTGAGLPPTSA